MTIFFVHVLSNCRKGLSRVTLSISQLKDTRTEQFCNTTNLVVPCILNHLPTTVKCQAKGSFPMLIQLFCNAQLLLKQNVTNANHAVQHTISSPRSGIYQCIARNEYGSKQSSLDATVSGKRYHVVVHCRVCVAIVSILRIL